MIDCVNVVWIDGVLLGDCVKWEDSVIDGVIFLSYLVYGWMWV